MANKVSEADGVVVLTGKEGIVLTSAEGGMSFDSTGDQSYLILNTQNLAYLTAGKNSVAIYDDKITGGMIDIQADTQGAVNLAVQDGATQNTAVTVTNGEAHVGVFKVGTFDRLHVVEKKVTLESAVGPVAVPTNLGKVEVEPDKVTISSLKSKMEVNVDGFTFEPAAGTIALKLTTKVFSVEATNGSALKIDLLTGKVEIKALMVDIESKIGTSIKTLENEINTKITGIESKAITKKQLTEAIKRAKTTIKQETTQAIDVLKASLQKKGP
jgi:hypothetical protein